MRALHLTDPMDVPREHGMLARAVLPYLEDERDLPFVRLAAEMTLVLLPCALALFLAPRVSWWLALAYWALLYGCFFDRYILMLHATSHRRLFRREYEPLNKFVTYRTRGGPAVQDAFFSPTTQTPYTDDLQIGYGVDLGNNMSFDAQYFNRRSRDILEDYDLELYADPNGYPGPINDPNSLFLGYDNFGYTENPGSNFVIGTLAGGKRDFNGLEFVFRKRFANRWQLLTSYNWLDAKGNTNSDSNADFQGDVDYLDPRAPNQYGTQPGLIRHLAKGAASYTFDFGLQLGGTFSWNSGTVASRTALSSGRNLPVRVSAAEAFQKTDRGMKLSYDRAAAVAQALAEEGVPWSQMRVVACGDGERLQLNAYDRAEHAKNERVEVVFVSPSST